MNLNTSKKHTAAAVDIDALLQDSFLLVVQLRQGASAHNGEQLKALCVKQVEQVSQSLKDAGLNQRSIDHICHAQCALLDETMLNCAKDDAEAHAHWASEPLQAKFFNRHQAGEFLYEDMREVLLEPAPDLHVLTAFQRVLMLGFQGRYRNANDPERLQLLADLNTRVNPLKLRQTLAGQVLGRQAVKGLDRLRSPLFHLLAASLLLVGVWWGLDHLLGGLVATLLPAGA
ncbi:type VI secretion system protein TssL, short form [Pseudomonas mohnii]